MQLLRLVFRRNTANTLTAYEAFGIQAKGSPAKVVDYAGINL
jgi:hypothetical protein